MRIAAYDSGNPEERVYTEMPIYVTRNDFPPVFAQTSYSRVILGNTPLGTSIIQMIADDRDVIKLFLSQCLVDSELLY